MTTKNNSEKIFLSENPEISAKRSAVDIVSTLGQNVIIKELPEIKAWSLYDNDEKLISLFMKDDYMSKISVL